MIRRIIIGLTIMTSAVVATAPAASAAPRGGNKGGELCMWVPVLNMGICIPL